MTLNDRIRADDPGGALAAAFTVLSAATVTTYRKLTTADVIKWGAANGTRKALGQAADNYNHPQYELAAAARSALEHITELDLNDSEVVTLLDSMAAVGLISATALANLYTRAEITQLKYPGLTIGQVEAARAGVA